jgi:CRP/FNR family transcriptional regulator, cyclic AMP receptor protein
MEWTVFADVPAEDLRPVLAIARRRTFRRGEVVFHQHDPADSLHLVVSGRFAIRTSTQLGEESLLSIRGPDDVFGELALVSGEARTATVVALEPSETLAVHRTDFDGLRRRRPEVDRMLVLLLARSLARMDELLAESYYVTAERRVVRRLLDAAETYGGRVPDTEIPLTQEQLASLAGASRQTVSAVLSRERRRGTIDLGRGRVILRDPTALARRAGLPPPA